jgi:hypothetical protein
MTPHEIELAKALNRCSGWVGARFITDAAATADLLPQHEISLRQRHYLEILAWRYRRQLPSHLVPEAKPPGLPRTRKEPRRKKEKQPAPDLFCATAETT